MTPWSGATDDPAAFPLPTGIPYRPTGIIGRGSTATVLRAEHTTHGGEVALKVFHRVYTAQDLADFKHECELQWRLSDHSNVVRLLDASSTDVERPWTVMELYDFSVAARMPGSARWDVVSARRWALDLLRGLAAVHAYGHVHRDVKPSNVLVRRGVAALGDFGCVLDLTVDPWDRATGTPGFTAPELLAGSAPSFRSDVYSAAITVRDLLGPDLPDAVETVLTRAGSHDPADRPEDADAFLRTLEAVLHDWAAEPAERRGAGTSGGDAPETTVLPLLPAPFADAGTSASTAGTGAGMPTPRRRRRRAAVLGLAVCLAAGAGTARWEEVREVAVTALNVGDAPGRDATGAAGAAGAARVPGLAPTLAVGTLPAPSPSVSTGVSPTSRPSPPPASTVSVPPPGAAPVPGPPRTVTPTRPDKRPPSRSGTPTPSTDVPSPNASQELVTLPRRPVQAVNDVDMDPDAPESRVEVENRRSTAVEVLWEDRDGDPDLILTVGPGQVVALVSYATHTFTVRESGGPPLFVFVVEERPGRVTAV